jgi:hypothetical protein
VQRVGFYALGEVSGLDDDVLAQVIADVKSLANG